MAILRPVAGVAMCVYNGAAYLQEQLDSIAAQTELPRRMAIVDDGSVDGSWELLQRWAPTAPFEVRLHRNTTNLGVVRNFERALALAGDDIDLVFLADQDDRWFADKLATFVDRFAADPGLCLLHSDAELIDSEGVSMGRRLFQALLVTDDERSQVAGGRAWRVYAKRNLVTGAACAFRRSLLEGALPFSPLWVHDEWLAFVAALTARVGLLDVPTMAYRLHRANTVGMPIPSWGWRLRTIAQAFFTPMAPRQILRAERLTQMVERAEHLGADAQAIAWIRAAAEHAQFRGHLPRNPLRRAIAVSHSWRRRDYHRWSNGKISMLHDLLIAT
ncbi:glycosyltransferase [Xylophilus rhododendri]|uniref:Glycosyltransferase n=1 Tax=Xylophilus rhododendri TaxID=2697032 RepID=A0A857J4Z1_9BURK|nr:glycosyltransferase family 2 protein [Xylophilus rhododendri]QHI97915.1 glycosyltransferase [Xylophilus rhododendri]